MFMLEIRSKNQIKNLRPLAPPPISGGAPVVTIGCTGCTGSTTVVTSPEGFTFPKLEVSIGCSSAQSTDAVVPEQAVQVILNKSIA